MLYLHVVAAVAFNVFPHGVDKSCLAVGKPGKNWIFEIGEKLEICSIDE